MEKRLINLESSEYIVEMEYEYMCSVCYKISKEMGIGDVSYTLHQVLDILYDKSWISNNLYELATNKLNKGDIYYNLDNNDIGEAFVDMLKDKIQARVIAV